MKSGKRGPSLFEAMSRAPQARDSHPTGRFETWLKRRGNAKPARAEALTEQEALAAMATQSAIKEPVREAPPVLRPEAPRTLAIETTKDEPKTANPEGPWLDTSNGRLKMSLSTPTCVALFGLLCVLMLGAYSMGRIGASIPTKMPSVAALTRPASNSEEAARPETPASKSNPAKKVAASPMNPDLSELLKKPPSRTEPVAANRPAVTKSEPAGVPRLPEDLNYLQIESFRITRERNGEQLAQDLAEVRSFLAEHGVRTFARKRNNGFSLFAEEGFSPNRDKSAEREAFRHKIVELGRLYRGSGGLYQFKGCLFVNYAMTKAGDPV